MLETIGYVMDWDMIDSSLDDTPKGMTFRSYQDLVEEINAGPISSLSQEMIPVRTWARLAGGVMFISAHLG